MLRMRCSKSTWWLLGLLAVAALLGGAFQGRERLQAPRQDGPPAHGSTARAVTPQAVAAPAAVPQVPGTPLVASVISPDPAPAARGQVEETYGKLPLHFEANQGQTDAQVAFLARGKGYTLFLTATEAVLTLRNGEKAEGREQKAASVPTIPNSGIRNPQSAVLRVQLVGGNPRPQVTGAQELRGTVNYFRGNDPTQWRTQIPTYAKVRYQDV